MGRKQKKIHNYAKLIEDVDELTLALIFGLALSFTICLRSLRKGEFPLRIIRWASFGL